MHNIRHGDFYRNDGAKSSPKKRKLLAHSSSRQGADPFATFGSPPRSKTLSSCPSRVPCDVVSLSSQFENAPTKDVFGKFRFTVFVSLEYQSKQPMSVVDGAESGIFCVKALGQSVGQRAWRFRDCRPTSSSRDSWIRSRSPFRWSRWRAKKATSLKRFHRGRLPPSESVRFDEAAKGSFVENRPATIGTNAQWFGDRLQKPRSKSSRASGWGLGERPQAKPRRCR